MKIDIYKEDKEIRIYKRGQVNDYGEYPEYEPITVCTSDDEMQDWINDNIKTYDDDTIRVCKSVGYYDSSFADDVLNKAKKLMDDYRSEGESIGWGKLEIDYRGMTRTFRASAAWKDMPTYYTFEQSLKWSNRKEGDNNSRVDSLLHMLWGYAEALHELGLDLVYTVDFELHLFGVRKIWVSRFEY